jgi:tetratricopeptide (TPR) repeat protein
VNLGEAYADLGDHERALAAFDRAIAENPQNLMAHVDRASLYSKMLRYEMAGEDFARASRLVRDASSEPGDLRVVEFAEALGDQAATVWQQALEEHWVAYLKSIDDTDHLNWAGRPYQLYRTSHGANAY